VFLAALTVPLASCGSGPKLSPVTGKVLYAGQPAEGATVVFHLINGAADAPKPSGTVAADGSFRLTTYKLGEGAPPGEYVVAVTWFPPNARELANPRSKLPERYGDPSASPLRATVREEPTELQPFLIPK
jgi:hypothetical protein